MPNYSYQCEKCASISDHFCKYEDRPEQIVCDCGGMAKFKLIPPGIMTHSYMDGQGRKGYKDLKEASKLNVAAARTDNPQEKAEIKKEMKKTGYSFEK